MIKYNVIFNFYSDNYMTVLGAKRSYFVKAHDSEHAVLRAKWKLFLDGLTTDSLGGISEICVRRVKRYTYKKERTNK